MQKKVVKGTTENLNILNKKVEYIGFKLGEVPEFLNEFEPLNYKAPKVYDDTTYKVYKYIPIKDIEILITPTNRLEDLSEKYKFASPVFTYMKAKNIDDSENLEKYARFLKMINQTSVADIEKISKEQDKIDEVQPFEVKFSGNFKWQIYYSEYAKKYFMLASTDEYDNSQLFYLLKRKIEINKSKKKSDETIFVPINNEEYSEKILKKSEISDIENYLWLFTKNWPSIYEVTDKKDQLSLQIVGETKIYDGVTSKFNLKYEDKKEAAKEYKLIKALFILAYDIPDEFYFDTRIDYDGNLMFCYEGERIDYNNLPEFLKKQAIKKIRENIRVKIETKDLKADIIDLQRHSKEQNEEYLKKESQIYTFLECKKTFMGKVKYFFKGKKAKKEETNIAIDKERMKDILSKDKKEEKMYDNDAELDKLYTVEDIIKICRELNESIKENKNIRLDVKALKNKIENLDRKIKNATQYIEEIEKHKKSIFEFWKFANKDEVKSLEEGDSEKQEKRDNLKRTFNYYDDLETLANDIDKKQRVKLSSQEKDATFAAKFVLDGINVLSKKKVLKTDEEKVQKLLESLKGEYKDNIEKIEKKDVDIFGNVSEDKTKIKKLNNNSHRESEKDKFKILNVNLNTDLADFMEKLVEIRTLLENESNKIETPYDLSIYKATTEEISDEGFDKFDLNPQATLEKIEKEDTDKEIYLYKINIPEKTNLIFYTNIIFFENNNETLPLGMDISQETLINLDLYDLEEKGNEEFFVNVCKNEFDVILRKLNVIEYDIRKKGLK